MKQDHHPQKLFSFLSSNKLAVFSLFLCILISTLAHSGYIHRRNHYAAQLNNYILSATNTLDSIRSHPDNLSDDDFQILYEKLITISVFQNTAYPDHTAVSFDGFHCIYTVLRTGHTYNDEQRCEPFSADDSLSPGELDFLRTLYDDLNNLSQALTEHQEKSLCVNIKYINHLLSTFDEKYEYDGQVYSVIHPD